MEAREFIADSLSFDVDVDVNLFECTIRVLGSMLSAFHLTRDELYKDRAVRIAGLCTFYAIIIKNAFCKDKIEKHVELPSVQFESLSTFPFCRCKKDCSNTSHSSA